MEIIKHSLAHVMAAAVFNLYPKSKFGIGPTIENGFYYDIDFGNQKISPKDLKKIQKKMHQLIKQDLKFKKEKITLKQAKKIFKNEPYKLKLLKDLEKKGTTKKQDHHNKKISKVTIYQTGNFVDLCRGPHIKNTKQLKSIGFKLNKLAGAYWRGDENNKMLTRVYGLAFKTKKDLKQYLNNLIQAQRRDHRKLGKKLKLFSFHKEGPGLPFWHNNGLIVKEELINFWRQEHKKAGYIEISTPIILKESLWQTSGHMKNYKENMYFTKIDNACFAIKPMNCPGGLLMYKEEPHSYKELPLRVAELGLVHRHEMAGVLHGLFRVRAFTQDDAHIYCTNEQIVKELKGVINLTRKIYHTFDFSYEIELSTRPKKYIGNLKTWNKAEKTLKKVLKELKMPFQINPGDGAFYGPKIDFHIKDSLNRTWQCGTLQLDFAQPENFNLEYTDKQGNTHQPVMLHRTIYGSLERFLGILIEHYAGAFPLWLAPIQIILIPVSRKHNKITKELKKYLKANQPSLRIKINKTNETVSYKIRTAAKQKVPYTIVIGDKESAKINKWSTKNKINIRKFGQKKTKNINLKSFLAKIEQEIRLKK